MGGNIGGGVWLGGEVVEMVGIGFINEVVVAILFMFVYVKTRTNSSPLGCRVRKRKMNTRNVCLMGIAMVRGGDGLSISIVGGYTIRKILFGKFSDRASHAQRGPLTKDVIMRRRRRSCFSIFFRGKNSCVGFTGVMKRGLSIIGVKGRCQVSTIISITGSTLCRRLMSTKIVGKLGGKF